MKKASTSYPGCRAPVRRLSAPHTAYEERETILPPDLWQHYEAASIWRDPAFNKRGVDVGKGGGTPS